MDEQDPGILGNLPRSRPGTRSEKRAREENLEQAAGAPPVEPSTAVPGRSASSRPRKPRKPKATDTAARHRATRASATGESATPPRPRATRPSPAAEEAAARATDVNEPREPRAPTGPRDPITGAVQLMGRVASVGVQVGTGVAREVLRRLPGPW